MFLKQYLSDLISTLCISSVFETAPIYQPTGVVLSDFRHQCI